MSKVPREGLPTALSIKDSAKKPNDKIAVLMARLGALSRKLGTGTDVPDSEDLRKRSPRLVEAENPTGSSADKEEGSTEASARAKNEPLDRTSFSAGSSNRKRW